MAMNLNKKHKEEKQKQFTICDNTSCSILSTDTCTNKQIQILTEQNI